EILLSSSVMDVFVVPVGPDRYELYCEVAGDPDVAHAEPLPGGLLSRLRRRFAAMLAAAEERQHRHPVDRPDEAQGWPGRLQERTLAWVVERIAEQRLLWH